LAKIKVLVARIFFYTAS